MDEALRLDRIRKALGARILLHDVTLRVGAGEAVALVGPSGSGKTTLLRIVAGLDVPDSGDVWIAGQHATQRPGDRRAAAQATHRLRLPGSGVVAAHDRGAEPRFRADFRGAIRRSRRTASHDRGDAGLVQIKGLGDRYPHQLSGGEQQRAAFARALVHRPPLLLLDEPFSSLDADLRHDMRTTLSDLRSTLGFAMVFVTHDRAEATAVADRTVIPTEEARRR